MLALNDSNSVKYLIVVSKYFRFTFEFYSCLFNNGDFYITPRYTQLEVTIQVCQETGTRSWTMILEKVCAN